MAAYPVIIDLRAERLLHLRDGTAGIDEHIVGRHIRDGQALPLQEAHHLLHIAGGGRKKLVELVGRQILAVLWRLRVIHGRQKSIQLIGVAQLQANGEVQLLVRVCRLQQLRLLHERDGLVLQEDALV